MQWRILEKPTKLIILFLRSHYMWRLCMLLSTQHSSWFYTKAFERPLWTYCAATSDHQIHLGAEPQKMVSGILCTSFLKLSCSNFNWKKTLLFFPLFLYFSSRWHSFLLTIFPCCQLAREVCFPGQIWSRGPFKIALSADMFDIFEYALQPDLFDIFLESELEYVCLIKSDEQRWFHLGWLQETWVG